MSNADLYKGFSPEKQAGYEAWLIDRYGEPMRESIEHSRKSFGKLSAAERESLQQECADVEQALAGALRNGVDPASEAVGLLLLRHRAWVSTMWGKPCPPQAYSGLADLYLSHPDFIARYESIEEGFAEFLAGAMKIHAGRWADSKSMRA